MIQRLKLVVFASLLVFGVGKAHAQKRTPIDYSDDDCASAGLCENEKKALLHAGLVQAGYLAKHRHRTKVQLAKTINEIRAMAHRQIFKGARNEANESIGLELDLLKKMLAKETLYTQTLNSALSEFPESKCVFADVRFNSEIIYRLCAERKLTEKLSHMLKRLGETPAKNRVAALFADISNQITRYNLLLTDTSLLVESGEVVRSNIESVPYLSVVGEPKEWLDLIYSSFSEFANSAAAYRLEAQALSGFLKAISDTATRKKAIQREKQRLADKVVEIDREARRVQDAFDLHLKDRHNTERELANSKERARSFVRNLPSIKNVKRAKNLSGIANYTKYTILTGRGGEQVDFPFDLGDAYDEVTHIDIGLQYDIGVTFDGATYQSLNGKYRPVKSQKGVPVPCGDSCLAPKQPRGILLVRFLCKIRGKTLVENIAVGTGALVDNPTLIPHVGIHCRRFGFALNEDQERLRGLKHFAFSKSNLSIQYSSYVSAYAEFTRSTKEISAKGGDILRDIPHTPFPLVAGKNALESHLRDVNISDDTIAVLEPYLTEVVNQRLISYKLERMDFELRDLSAQKTILKNRGKALSVLIEGLESAINDVKSIEVLDDLARSYSIHNLETTFSRMFREISTLEKWLYVYSKSVLYRYPEKREIEENFNSLSAILRAFYQEPTPFKEGLLSPGYSINVDHCKSLSSLGSDIEVLCKSFDKSKEAEHVKDILKQFLIKEDQKWRVEQTVSQQLIKHCYIDFSNARGENYLEQHHDGAKSIRDLFHKEKWLEKYYFPRADESKFSKVVACHLLGSSFVERCLHKSDRNEVGDYLMDMIGYFEVPVTSIVNEPELEDNMVCSDGYSDHSPIERLLGVSIESDAKNKKLPAKVPVFVEKSNRSWVYRYSSSGIKRHEAQVYNSGSVKVTTPGRLNIRPVNIYSKEHLTGPKSGFACASNYASKKCITAQFGEVLNDTTGGYRFRTSFLNSRIGNDWVIRVPVFSKNDQSRNQKELIDKMDNLVIHFYLNQVAPR